MKDIFKNDRTIIVELLSALSFLIMAIELSMSNVVSSNVRNVYFWTVIFSIFSGLQILGIKLKFELILLRICMAWAAGSVWVTLALGSINNVLAVPVLMIGLFNLYAFILLTHRATVDWQKFFNRA